MTYFPLWPHNPHSDGREIDHDGRRRRFLHNFEFGYPLRCAEIKKSILQNGRVLAILVLPLRLLCSRSHKINSFCFSYHNDELKHNRYELAMKC